jgi:hypothetical protein
MIGEAAGKLQDQLAPAIGLAKSVATAYGLFSSRVFATISVLPTAAEPPTEE